jgi:hydrogenase maturation protease
MSDPRILVIGYGNPGRQDDGLGPAVATGIGQLGWANLTVYDNYQLSIDDAAEIAEHEIVWFVDAAKAGPEPYFVRDLAAASSVEFTSHVMRPEAVLAIARDCFGCCPQAFLLGVRGYAFEFVEQLTPAATLNMRAALAMLTDRIRTVQTAAPQ